MCAYADETHAQVVERLAAHDVQAQFREAIMAEAGAPISTKAAAAAVAAAAATASAAATGATASLPASTPPASAPSPASGRVSLKPPAPTGVLPVAAADKPEAVAENSAAAVDARPTLTVRRNSITISSSDGYGSAGEIAVSILEALCASGAARD